MTDNVKPFPAERIDAGYDTYSGDFRAGYSLTDESQNITVGFNLGASPRFGMAPIPGHSDTETATNSLIGGLMATEASSNALGMRNRLKVFGVVPLKCGSWSDLNTKKTHYLWITAGGAFADATKSLLSATFDAERNATTTSIFEFKSNLAKGIGLQTSSAPANIVSTITSRIGGGGNMQDIIYATLAIDSSLNYASIAAMSVPSRPQSSAWIVAANASGTSATLTYPPNLRIGAISTGGFVSAPALQNMPKDIRPVSVYGIRLIAVGTYGLALRYLYTSKNFDGTYYKSKFSYDFANDATSSNLNLNTVAADQVIDPLDGAASVTDITGYYLINDEALTLDNAYQFVGVAAKKPFAFFMHDWDRGYNGTTVSMIDLTNQKSAPRPTVTYNNDPTIINPLYYETPIAGGGAIQTQTAFSMWPTFTAGTALANCAAVSYDGINMVTLGAAGSGVLRANRIYEITYSVYDKKLNYETNVGAPAKIQVGSADFVALSLFRDSKGLRTSGTVFDQTPQRFNSNTIINIFSTDPGLYRTNILEYCNQYEFRFYYRELGTFEWLPALFIDASKFFYYTDFEVLWACEGSAVGTVGGQPGGFNDYSPLPNEQYTCCVTFKGRMFWLSPQNMHWSLTNNPICYSINNTYSAPGGEFRGSIIHQFRGESDLESQLIVFGSKEVYFGDFTGNPTIQSVQISADTIAQFPVDGSDFVLQTMTTNTAFSYRSAVSADGDLYYWGPQGVFVRKGTEKPEKISLHIEPELMNLYDGSKIDEIHCVYDSATRQVTWFYPPKVADADNPTYGLSLDIDNGEFFPLKFAGKIDGSQKLTIENDDSPTVAQGDRTLVFSRASTAATVQRAYFYDHFCKSGDIYPGQEMLVKSFSTPATGQRTFTLASGYDNTLLSSIVAGDLVGVVGSDTYATSLTHAEPFIGTVVSVGVGTITLKLPDGVSFDASGSLTEPEYFQLYAKNIHSFAAKIATKYWTPGGMLNYWFFLYLYGLFKLNPLLPSRSSQDLTIGYTTPLNSDNFESTLQLRDNSRGNYQVYKALDQSHAYAQAIRFIIEEDHYAGSWVLQSLILMAQQQSSDEIKTYEE